MRRLAVAVLVAGLAMLLSPLVPTASATDSTPSRPGSLPATTTWLSLGIQSLAPRIVQASDTSVTVTGTVTNISDRDLTQVRVRLQLGSAITDASKLRPALDKDAPYTQGVTSYEPITDSLAPGRSVSFTVTEPLQGAHSLNVTAPGVFPLLVNVQGLPDYSTSQYRLAGASMLLPVLAAPGGTPPARPAAPAGLTVLWPLVDTQPRVVATEPNGQRVLSDDSLATSLAPGGRLFGLVDSVRQVAAGHPEVLDSLCFAVDPDLLDTVQGMAAGYQVRSGAGTVAGSGGTFAAAWLTMLRSLTAGHCVLPLPYADADVAALSHAGGGALAKVGFGEAASVGRTLGASPLTDLAWPADGAADSATMSTLAGAGAHTVLLDPNSVSPPAGTAPVTVGTERVLPIDQLASSLLAARTDQPNVDDAGIAAQDGLGGAVFRTVFDGAAGQSVLIAPPRRWTASAGESLAYLRGIDTLLSDRFATAAPLAELAVAGGARATVSYPPQASGAEVAHTVAATAVADAGQQQDLVSAMRKDHTRAAPTLPSALIDPIQLGLLRAVSGAWRDGHTAGATAALAAAEAPFTSLTRQVTVVQPSLPISLGSQNSKLPVTVVNPLPVDILVKVGLSGEAGLAAGSDTETRIPAGGSDTVMVDTRMTRSGRFSVYATLSTPGGTPLGERARFELVSNAYGTIILIVTGTAFGLLVLLSGRRIYRRVRAARLAEPVGAGGTLGPEYLTDEPHDDLREPSQQ